eukprot:6476672-Amphidinium_carterae.1
MALAGCYLVSKSVGSDATQVAFAPLADLFLHLSRAESYVLRYSVSFTDPAIVAQLRSIDEAIRSKWAELLRQKGEGSTLGDCIIQSEPVAA